MKHFFTTRIRVILIVAVLLAVALTVISSLTGFSLPDMVVKGVLTPIRTGVSRLTDQAEQLYSYMFKYESLAAENERLKEQQICLELTENAQAYIVNSAYDPQYGARPLRRYVQHTVETMLAKKLLAGQVLPGTTVRVDGDENGLFFV